MFDLVLHGGRVLDGTGNVDIVADVAISGVKIAAIGRLATAEARERLDVSGLTVCPGFVDAHCHSDALPFAADPLPAKILQGVTTEVNGNCGSAGPPVLIDGTAAGLALRIVRPPAARGAPTPYSRVRDNPRSPP